jgi:16S rRNA (uracil1498-N3)-methyltransferase
MTRIIVPSITDPLVPIEITGDEAHYLIRVRRHTVGDRVEVREGSGRRFAATVAQIRHGTATLTIGAELEPAPDSWPVALIVVVPRGRLLDDVARKASEIGIAELAPAISERSTARPSQQRLARWRRIADESARQCGRRRPLVVHEPSPLENALERFSGASRALILDPGASDQGLAADLANHRQPGSVALAVGPAGGFSPEELDTAKRLGFSPIGLGPTILRVETATLVAATLAVAFAGGFD